MTNPILKDGERIDQLFSTDVKIIQNKEVFSYSIDSVLLSRFPKIPKKGLIVDLCSGNGAVGLFASTRTEAPITLVELQERLADMAQRSVTLNQLEDQVTVVNDDLKNLLDHTPRSQVDLILCNPPYFKAMRQYNLAPKRIQFIYPKMGREANMLLIEAIKDGSTDGLKILPPLFVHKKNGDYTDEIFEIYFGKKAESES